MTTNYRIKITTVQEQELTLLKYHPMFKRFGIWWRIAVHKSCPGIDAYSTFNPLKALEAIENHKRDREGQKKPPKKVTFKEVYFNKDGKPYFTEDGKSIRQT